jgi:hypothetical protein
MMELFKAPLLVSNAISLNRLFATDVNTVLPHIHAASLRRKASRDLDCERRGGVLERYVDDDSEADDDMTVMQCLDKITSSITPIQRPLNRRAPHDPRAAGSA